MRCVLAGNFSGRTKEFFEIYDAFQNANIEVISPPRELVSIFSADFLNSQHGKVFKALQNARFLAIKYSDFFYVLTPRGIQRDEKTELEIGAAVALRVPVFATEKYEDISMNLYALYVPPKELVKDVNGYIKEYNSLREFENSRKYCEETGLIV